MDYSTSLYIRPRVAAKKYGVTRPSGQKRERSDSFDVERESPRRINTCLQTSSAISTSSVHVVEMMNNPTTRNEQKESGLSWRKFLRSKILNLLRLKET